jgi:UDP:flavonoid glycosyltransferase YjiC (YdhE family)
LTVLVSFVGGWGHAEPLLPLARLASARGHRIVAAGQGAVLPRLGGLGLETVEVGPDTLSTDRRPLVAVDRAMERVVVRDHFVAEFGHHRSGRLGAVIDTHGPDLVVCDEMDAGAVLAAERAGVPCITVGVLAAGRLGAPDVIGPAWAQLRAGAGLPEDPDCHRFAGDVRLDPTPSSFRDPASGTPPQLVHVRPPILDQLAAPPPPGTVRPLVYATLGTVFDVESGDLFGRLVDALALLERECLLTIGWNVGRDELPAAPGRVRVEPFVAQADVVPGCAAVVCHGGSGTLTAALSVGVPVVVLPMGADQPDNADRCAELGVGIVLDATTAEARDIAAAVDAVTHDARYRRAAERLAAEAARQPRIADIRAVTDRL